MENFQMDKVELGTKPGMESVEELLDQKCLEFIEKRIKGETKAIIYDLDLSKQNYQTLLYLNIALSIDRAVKEGTVQPPIKHLRLGKPSYIYWFTGITSVFGFLIVGITTLTFAVYFGYRLGYADVHSELKSKQMQQVE